MFKKRPKRKVRVDYQTKKMKNPFFKEKKQGRGRFLKPLIISFIFIILALGWLFFVSSVFSIKKINIEGLTRIDQSEISQLIKERFNNKRLFFLSQDNIFLFPKDESLAEINERYNFSQIEIKKILPDSLKIVISERPYAFIFQEGSDLYYASSDAYLIKEEAVKEEDYTKYFILENKSEAVYVSKDNKIIIKTEYLNFVFSLAESLKEYPNFKVERFIIDQELNSLTLKFLDGPLVYFNVKNEAATQLADLELVKKEKIGDNFNSTKYIDLRYGKMIYIN